MVKFGSDDSRTVEEIAEETYEYLEDIRRYSKEVWLEDLKRLPIETLKKLEKESLYLVVTLGDIDTLVKKWRKE